MFAPGGMIVREREPLNLEMPFGSLDGFITPVDRFFVRSHFAIPSVDVKTWVPAHQPRSVDVLGTVIGETPFPMRTIPR